ncbi:MAG TPA: DNA mismatch repair protein MutS [Candidatus Rikenella faecigallinarum]|uniref:DNA mismatch repair protein MutS n=1 Tax=Candidatus Rikenella faecigallinarum TaxID=2838745 RepID=A0A9D1QD29_9BACT|nr:DNA mismatch repair protein MutS [Candidatus Rikenella faecigallinarum]
MATKKSEQEAAGKDEPQKKYALTPLMKQYYTIKAQHPDAILLFRAGDFYETFGPDAVTASSILGITLTKRANGAAASVELAGFPYHALDVYLPKLVRAGQRVAVCEQLEDPKKAKGIVKRGVTELVTPGVTFDDNILENKENTYLASVALGQKGRAGAAFIDISTGEFYAAEGSVEYIDKLLANLMPKEVVYKKGDESEFRHAFGERYYTYKLDEWAFNYDTNREKLLKQFDVTSLKGFGIDLLPLAVSAAGAVIYYLEYTEHKDLSHVRGIARLDQDKYVWLDRYSIRNLELFHPLSENGTSLTDIIDHTSNPMGARLLRRWISLPLKEKVAIDARLEVVNHMMRDVALRDALGEELGSIGDLERIVSKIAVGRVNPRELVQLGKGIAAAERVSALCAESPNAELRRFAERFSDCTAAREAVERTLLPEPALIPGRGPVIAYGVHEELDSLREIATGGKDYLLALQQRESEAVGIPLKISYNNVFGYYIEVRNAHRDKVPEGWIRKQTLVNAERYVTEELKEYEEKILGAEDKINAIEVRLYNELVVSLQPMVAAIQANAMAIAELDCLQSFAQVAIQNNYCRPEITEDDVLEIKDGRHPVIEQRLPIGEPYIPNDLYLDTTSQQIIIITGPNMAGKSALLRQTALIVLMAQIGCFVPASSARVGIIDRIFTRVGASDNISQGESTFMVEMLESANILNNISGRSLVLLDEIGRGTSTYDGISIAWAMVEYLHENPAGKAKTLFATHYHELNEMASRFERIKNFNVQVREVDKRVIFLRKLVPGGTEHSFGIHVAKMAGMPPRVIDRAKAVLEDLERQRRGTSSEGSGGVSADTPDISGVSAPDAKRGRGRHAGAEEGAMQLSFFQLDDPVLKEIRDQIRGLDINSLTPIEALNKLNEIKKLSGL